MDGTSYSFQFEKSIAAPRALVWRAWTSPEELKAWYRPDPSWSTPVAEIDLRRGGKYRIGLQPRVGPMFYEVGMYRDIKVPDLLVYTLRFLGTHLQFEGAHLDRPTGAEMEKYETLITLAFEGPPQGTTRLLVNHGGYRTEEERDRHREGWPRFLESFAQHCVAAAQTSDE